MSSSSRPSLFSRLSSSSSSSTRSSSASSLSSRSESTCARYAKDGKGFDFASTYPYKASDVSVAGEPSAHDLTLRYAKDGKGHDFSASYSPSLSIDALPLVPASSPAPVADFAGMRYAKDGKGYDFASSYLYNKY
ncbi:hypothetical protein LTR10_019655 [Elasticomyces elasticus]|uniref:Uncharacterized protein n=1 Tax=Exophiala sideris TaxID=1016849 RepID=A0ABR0JFL0_9EURO|nr:hypothetical protein LTR10_019655 [Elasticomyces elasticus]KAK5025769.1 hypothetical protein LTS07_007973 [Exophiala sideris]KAK5033023.1 hypothetical protein LTR13_006988 [Exophiala sideris]KAK5063508.1 hypothetical protein LTR69_004214 [Exophiala sideris]KAK5180660.1 hypothetical protein LTR44_006974 [Eurotiomycetes sp. CCFEE 6388]